MENIPKFISKTLNPLKLYLEDIEEIINILKEEKPKSIHLKIQEKKYTFEEIKNLNIEKIVNLEIISCFDEYDEMRLIFRDSGLTISCYKDKIAYHGLVQKLCEYLETKVRPISKIKRNRVFQPLILIGFFGAALFLIPTYIDLYNINITKTSLLLIEISCITLLVLTIIINQTIKYYSKNIIFLNNSHHYIKKSKETLNRFFRDLAIAVISTSIGILVGHFL